MSTTNMRWGVRPLIFCLYGLFLSPRDVALRNILLPLSKNGASSTKDGPLVWVDFAHSKVVDSADHMREAAEAELRECREILAALCSRLSQSSPTGSGKPQRHGSRCAPRA